MWINFSSVLLAWDEKNRFTVSASGNDYSTTRISAKQQGSVAPFSTGQSSQVVSIHAYLSQNLVAHIQVGNISSISETKW